MFKAALSSVLARLLHDPTEAHLHNTILPRVAPRPMKRTIFTLHKKAGFTARERQPGYLKPNIIKSRRGK